MSLAPTRELLDAAVASGGAVAGFNVITLEHAEAIARGAAEAGTAAILQLSENAIRFHGGDPRPILAGCRAVPVTVDDHWRIDLSAIDPADAARALCLWVNTPGNPAGGLDDLDAAAAWGRERGVPVFSDECYIEFTWHGPGRSILRTGTDGVVDPLSQPPAAGLLSRDGRAALVPVALHATSDAQLPEAAGKVMSTVSAVPPTMAARSSVGGGTEPGARPQPQSSRATARDEVALCTQVPLQASLVMRTTSSNEVSPCANLCTAASRSRRMPCPRAACSMTPPSAPLLISSRISRLTWNISNTPLRPR